MSALVAWLGYNNHCDISHIGTLPDFSIDTTYADHARFAIHGSGLYVTSFPSVDALLTVRVLVQDFAGRYADSTVEYSVYAKDCVCVTTTSTTTAAPTTTTSTTTTQTPTTTTLGPSTCFNKFGDDIYGAAANDYLGRSVDISDNGTYVIIGSPYNDDAGSEAGKVEVFEWTGAAWSQRGSDILGATGQLFGDDQYGLRGVAINGDGSIIAISSRIAGEVKVYEWNGSDWSQKGTTLSGTGIGDCIDLNNDGSILAVSNVSTSLNTGSVDVYEWDGSAYSQKGSTILGESTSDYFGYNLCLNSAGDIIVVGAPYNDGAASEAGHLRIYEWNGSAWSQKGQELDGNAVTGYFGLCTSISDDGLTVVGGAPVNNEGYVKVYSFSSEHGIWLQKGSDIVEGNNGDYFGAYLALSGDGDSLVVSAKRSNPNGTYSGKVRFFEWSGSAWTENCTDIDGVAAQDTFGNALALSSDANYLAIGGEGHDFGSIGNRGHVRTYSKFYLNPSSMPDEYFGSKNVITNHLP